MAAKIIVIGGSAGGFSALKEIMSLLPRDFKVPVAIVLHRASGFRVNELITLNHTDKVNLIEVNDKDNILAGNFYIAPPDYHLLIDKDYFSLSIDEDVNKSRPSIDVLFESAAAVYGENAVGVLLSGFGKDGSNGLLSIKNAGGVTIVQSPKTAEKHEMPDSAISLGAAEHILPPDKIAEYLNRLTVNR